MGRATLTFLGLSFACVYAACGGSDFTSDNKAIDAAAGTAGTAGTGASDAGSDASTGGQAGSGGQAGAEAGPAACDIPLPGNNCNEVTTGSPSCDTCGRANCCPPVDTCLADPDCRRLMSCFVNSCKGQDPIACGASACSACLSKGLGLFTGVSSCLQANCNAECPFKPGG